MLQKVIKELQGRHIAAADGEIGSVVDVYFDDERRAVRYLVVDTGDWLPGRQVLISPASVSREASNDDAVHLALSREQVRNSPGADSDMPVSRQFEEAHARYYGYPFYWNGPYLWGDAQQPVSGSPPVTTAADGGGPRVQELKQSEEQARHSHLRSTKEVTGYRVVAVDGPIGHVEDLVVNDDTWAISSLVVDTRNWLPGKEVLLPAEAISEVDWVTREVRVRATREEIKGAPKA